MLKDCLNINNETYLVFTIDNFKNLFDILKKINNIKCIKSSYKLTPFNKIILEYTKTYDGYIFIRIWKSFCFFATPFENCNSNKLIASLDYFIDYINEDIKVEYLYLNDKFTKNNKDYLLTDEESHLLKKSFLKYLKNVAKNKRINKITIDVHINLKHYRHYYEMENFTLTNNQTYDNPFWIEAEKIVIY